MSEDNYLDRRSHLSSLTDDELKEKFWDLLEEIVDPLIDLAKTHTSPSIERSVLLRMGFSSLECDVIVKKVIEKDLIRKGAGHVVYALSKKENCSIREAGHKLINDEGWDIVQDYFGGRN